VQPFLAVLVLLGMAGTVVAAIYALSYVLMVSGPLRVGPFLSGGRPREHAMSRYHVRWYAVTMVFLAFDMEMIFMFPWALVVESIGAKAVVEMFIFLGLLMAGVVYAWREGALRWT
jgi:NADH-quinone oxidoreductase subunit A